MDFRKGIYPSLQTIKPPRNPSKPFLVVCWTRAIQGVRPSCIFGLLEAHQVGVGRTVKLQGCTLPKTNSEFTPENRPGPKRKLILLGPSVSGAILVLGRVTVFVLFEHQDVTETNLLVSLGCILPPIIMVQ